MGTIRLIGDSDTEVARKKERRRGHGQAVGRFLSGVRSLFAFLLVATVFVFAFCYSPELQNYIVTHLYKWSQAELQSSALRQGALNHENEINQVAK